MNIIDFKDINEYILGVCSNPNLKHWYGSCDDLIDHLGACPMGKIAEHQEAPESYIDAVHNAYIEFYNNSPDVDGEAVDDSWCFKNVCSYGFMLGLSPIKTFELLVGFSTQNNEEDTELGFAICPCMKTISQADKQERLKRIRRVLFKPSTMETE